MGMQIFSSKSFALCASLGAVHVARLVTDSGGKHSEARAEIYSIRTWPDALHFCLASERTFSYLLLALQHCMAPNGAQSAEES